MKTRKIGLAILVFLLFQVVVQAQAASNPEHVNQVLSSTLLIAGIGIVFFALAALLKVHQITVEATKLELLREHGIEAAEQLGIKVNQESWWKRQYKKWTNVVPVAKEADIMLDHNYDGIQELDNSLPPWWLAMFYVSIAIG
ncbi:MAG: cbb3-type cytochrome c oxidase N-terminal domain-containing protein, partial [Bacteroidota bacterium]